MGDLSPIYGALAPDPNATYGQILPFARDNTTGATRWAMPDAVRSGLKGYLDLANSTQTGSLTGDALSSLTFGSLAGGGMLAPRGAIVAGGGPIRAYHGSPHNFDRFDINKAGSTTDPGTLGRAIYSSTDPRVAEKSAHRYELQVSPDNPLEIALPDFKTDKGQVIRDALGLPTSATAQEVADEAVRRGFDAAVLDYSPTGYTQQEIAAFNPEIIKILRKYNMAMPAPLSLAGPSPMPNNMLPTEQRVY